MTLDLTPFRHFTVGFDSLFDELENYKPINYPPYNISKIKDGEYKVGIRPHNITTYKEGSNSLEISGKVLISELSGSESLIHFTNGDLNWVSLSNGIHQKNVGEQTKLFMNSDEFLYLSLIHI